MQASDKLPTYPDPAGKVAVVTGGSGGIGSATCRLLAASGARVAVNGRDQARLDTVVEAIHAAGGTAIGVAADCTDLAAVERLRQQVEQDIGPAEVLAAFVGGGRARPGPVADVPEQDWHSTVDGSLTATFLTLKSFLPGMIERGRGAIVTMASSAARLPGLGAPAPYMAAKAGVMASDSTAWLTGVTLGRAGRISDDRPAVLMCSGQWPIRTGHDDRHRQNDRLQWSHRDQPGLHTADRQSAS